MESYLVEAFGRPLSRVVRDTPSPADTQVLVRVQHCGVCHSDVHLHDGYFDLGAGQRLDVTRSVPLPRALGHEVTGTVVAVGPDVRDVRVGDRRVVYPWIGCGACATCRAGSEHLCGAPRVIGLQHDGGFGSHVLVPHPRYLVDYEPLDSAQACTYACAGVTAYSATKKVMRAEFGDEPLLVVGAGGVGLSAIRLARHLMPGVPLIVAEVDASKHDAAREAGATEVIDPKAEGVSKALVKRTGGGVARAIDFVGSADTFAFALGALRKGGCHVSVGLFGGQATVLPVTLAMKAVSIIGSYVGSLAELRELIDLARQAKLPPLPVTLRPMALAQASLDDLRAGRVRGRVVLEA